MGKKVRDNNATDVSAAPPSFPSPCSSSSSDFEFNVSVSPTSGRPSSSQLCPADELFYKGQLLPLHLSPRITMVRTLLLSSSSTSSDSTGTTASRDSNGSSSSSSFSAADLSQLLLPSANASIAADCDSSRPSSVTDDDVPHRSAAHKRSSTPTAAAVPKYLSTFATRFSAVFLHRGSKKDPSADISDLVDNSLQNSTYSSTSSNINSSTKAREVIKKYVKKVKPFYDRLSSLQQKHQPQPQPQPQPHQQQKKANFSFSIRREKEASGSCILPAVVTGLKKKEKDPTPANISFSGNRKYPRLKRSAASCPSSMKSSPSHSGLLRVGKNGFPEPVGATASMEELQSAIQGAIAHCKSSMMQKNGSAMNAGESSSCDKTVA